MKKICLWLIVYAIALSGAWLTASLISDQKNNLYTNGNWTSSKISLQKGVVGAVAFFTTRTALAQEKLNLGVWHGFNEIAGKNAVDPKHVSFDLELEEKSEISFLFGKNETGFSGVKVTVNPNFQSGYFEADELGRFKKFVPFNVLNSYRSGTNRLDLEFGDKLVARLNNQEIGSVDSVSWPPGLIGFRAGSGKTVLDNVSVTDKNGAVFEESFSSKNKISLFVSFAVLISVLLGVFYYFSNTRNDLLNYAAMASASLFIFVGSLYLFDYFYYSLRYPSQESQITKLIYALNVSEFKNNIEYQDSIVRNALEKLAAARKGDFKVILLGSSQTWGAGAAKENQDLPTFLKNKLQEKLKRNVVVADLAVSGDRTGQMLDNFLKAGTSPVDLVILNASNNDGGGNDFRNNVTKIVERALFLKAQCVLVQEPNFIDEVNGNLTGNHKDLEAIAQKYNVGLVKLHQHLMNIRETGFLWWDNVHLTSLGQQSAANFIAESVPAHSK